MNKKKILIFTDFFSPHWTGISKSIDYLARGIGDYYDVTILTVRFNKSLKKREKRGAARIIREDFALSLSRSKYSVSIIFKFFAIVKNFDVILINSPSSNVLPISIIAKVFRKKLIIFHQGDLVLPKGIANRIIEVIFDISTYIPFFIADTVSTYTKDYAKHSRIIKPFLSKFEPMLLPVYIKNFKGRLRLIENLKKEKLHIFGFAGRFVEEKGFDVLFEAIPYVLKMRQDLRFVFAGETNIAYEDFFQKNLDKLEKIKGHVIMLGLLDKSDLVKFYNSIDFIVIPSRSDCFNLVQAEAMLKGVPSIVSDIPGARFLVDETSFGLKFEKENPQDLARKIIQAIGKRQKFRGRRTQIRKILNNNQNVKEIKNIIG